MQLGSLPNKEIELAALNAIEITKQLAAPQRSDYEKEYGRLG